MSIGTGNRNSWIPIREAEQYRRRGEASIHTLAIELPDQVGDDLALQIVNRPPSVTELLVEWPQRRENVKELHNRPVSTH